MKFFFPSEIERAGLTAEPHLLFVQRWHELFDEASFDAWQVRTSNIRTILLEIAHAVKTSEAVPSHFANVHPLVQEARDIAHRDIVIRRNFPFVPSYLDRLTAEYKTPAEPRICNLRSLSARTTVLLDSLRDYQARLVQMTRNLLSDPQTNRMKDIYDITMSLAVHFASLGYSTTYLSQGFDILCDPHPADLVERFDALTTKYDGAPSTFTCLFLVDWPTNIPPPYFIISSARPSFPENTPEHDFYSQNPTAHIARLQVEALDPYAARARAETVIDSQLAVLRLYQVQRQFQVLGRNALVTSPNGTSNLVSPDTTRLAYVRDTKNASERVPALVRLLDTMLPNDAAPLKAALQYHKLALSASTDDARLVNLWISLESLFRHQHETIIGSICRFLPPALSTSYLFRMIKALAIDLHVPWRRYTPNPFASLIPSYHTWGITPDQLLPIILAPDTAPTVQALPPLLSISPLLRHRLWHLRAEVFSHPRGVMQLLQQNHQNVDWQIRRIYRARNDIMHRGTTTLPIRHLVQHLHAYLVTVTQQLVHDLIHHPKWTVAEALEYRALLYAHLIQSLQNDRACDLSPQSILRPEMALLPRQEAPAWPPAPSRS